MNRRSIWGAALLGLAAAGAAAEPGAGVVSVADYASIPAAVKANPGRMLYVPAGDHVVGEKIRLNTDGAGLCGPGRILQSDTNAPVIEVEGAADVRVRDVTLTRPEGRTETAAEGVLAIRCRDLWIDDVRVIDNRTRSAAIALRECVDARIRGCLVRNYMRVTVDDRTASAHWGYAFNCIDGTGIAVSYSEGTLIQNNRVVENRLLPTPEIQRQFRLGEFIKKNPAKGSLVSRQTWDSGFVSNWHQGSAIIVTAPESSDLTQILGNLIKNAAQGIDVHADHVIVAQNVINNAFMGLKAMHGSRNVLITGNQFVKNDLWSIGLMPGAAAHPAAPPKGAGTGGAAANCDGGSIIANNIVSDFGYGSAHWVWGDGRSPFKFDNAQEPDDPPLTDVVVQGNVVYDPGREAGRTGEPPRYLYAVIVAGGTNGPKGLHFSGNLLHPGAQGVSNVPLSP